MSKEKKIKHEKKRKKRHIVRNIFLVLFLIIIISAIAAAFLGYNFYKKHKIEISNCIKDGYKKVEKRHGENLLPLSDGYMKKGLHQHEC